MLLNRAQIFMHIKLSKHVCIYVPKTAKYTLKNVKFKISIKTTLNYPCKTKKIILH